MYYIHFTNILATDGCIGELRCVPLDGGKEEVIANFTAENDGISFMIYPYGNAVYASIGKYYTSTPTAEDGKSYHLIYDVENDMVHIEKLE